MQRALTRAFQRNFVQKNRELPPGNLYLFTLHDPLEKHSLITKLAFLLKQGMHINAGRYNRLFTCKNLLC